MKEKYRKIGSTFEAKDGLFKVVEGDCKDCYLCRNQNLNNWFNCRRNAFDTRYPRHHRRR